MPTVRWAGAAGAWLLASAAALQLREARPGLEPAAPLRYSYAEHGQDWVQGRCGSRERQSPINFEDLEYPASGTGFYYNYQSIMKPIGVYNPNGLQLKLDFRDRGDGGLTYQNSWYKIISIEVHSISEHTFLGNHSPLELHVVHERDESEYDGPPYVTLALPVISPSHGFAEAKEEIPEPDISNYTLPKEVPKPSPTLKLSKGMEKMIKVRRKKEFNERMAKLAKAEAKAQAEAEKKGLVWKPWPRKKYYEKAKPTSKPKDKDDNATAEEVVEPRYVPPSDGDEGFSPLLQRLFLLSQPPGIEETAQVFIDDVEPLDINPLPEGGIYYQYLGSQIEPPCDESVAWFIRRNALMASDEQVRVLHSHLFAATSGLGNWRSVMPLNNRPLGVVYCKQGEPPLRADNYSGVRVGPMEVTEHELRADIMVKDALKFANQARDDMKDLDERLHKAADAHLDAESERRPPTIGGIANGIYGTTPPPGVAMAKEIMKVANQHALENGRNVWQAAKEAVQPAAEEAYDNAMERKAMIEAAKLAAAEANSPSPASAAVDAVPDEDAGE